MGHRVAIVRTESLHSDDDVLRQVRTRWRRSIGREYAGYVLFLFGDADESFATSFARSVVQLDSVTGYDVGFLVFARRVRIRAHRTVSYQREKLADPMRPLARRKGHALDFRDVKWSGGRCVLDRQVLDDVLDSDLVGPNGLSRMIGDAEEMSAITYAADDVARALGVLDQLPCAVVLDAGPHGRLPDEPSTTVPRRVVSLAGMDRKSLVAFMRKLTVALRDQAQFRGFRARVSEYLRWEAQVKEVEWAIRGLENERRAVQEELGQIPQKLEDLRAEGGKLLSLAITDLKRGSIRAMRGIAYCSAAISQETRSTLAALATEHGTRLERLHRTIGTLRWHAGCDWPLAEEQHGSLVRVVRRYASELLAHSESTGDVSRNAVLALIDELEEQQAQIHEQLERATLGVDASDGSTGWKRAKARESALRDALASLDSGQRLAPLQEDLRQKRRHCERLSSAPRPSAVQAADEALAALDHPESSTPAAKRGASSLRVLVLHANPLASSKLDIEREVREIKEQLRGSLFRDSIRLETGSAARAHDLVHLLRDVDPAVLHFSGHGSRQGIFLRGEHSDDAQLVPVQSLSRAVADRGIRLVVLNACYADAQAQALAKVVPCVVGTGAALDDEAAINFSRTFYRGLGSGRTIQESFRDAGDVVAVAGGRDVYQLLGNGDEKLV